MTWPETIRIEVKTTTGDTVPLPARELEALATKTDDELGILATLFWCGDRSVDGRWMIADAEDSFRASAAKAIAVSKQHMKRAHRGQIWLTELKAHVEDLWPAFLQAFLNDAMLGHEVLCKVLQDCHQHGTVAKRLPTERVLETDHRDAVHQIIDYFGESNAGHIFQDLFGYLVGHAGYREVLLNAVGVPDITVSGVRVRSTADQEIDLGRLPVSDVRKLLSHCQLGGDDRLANILRARLETSNRSSQADGAKDT